MDVIGFIGALNKVALFFFTLTLGFVIYEFVMFLKDRRNKVTQPTVPAFDPNMPLPQATPIHATSQAPQPLMKSNSHRVLQLVVALIIFTIVTVIMIVFRPGPSEQASPTPQVTQTIHPTVQVSPTQQVVIGEEPQSATESASLSTSPEASPTAMITTEVAITESPTPTSEVVVIAETTATPSATAIPSSTELPTAGIRFPYEMIGIIALSIVAVAFMF